MKKSVGRLEGDSLFGRSDFGSSEGILTVIQPELPVASGDTSSVGRPPKGRLKTKFYTLFVLALMRKNEVVLWERNTKQS